MRVPILRIPYQDEHIATVQQSVAEILRSGALTMGKFTHRFEAMFAEFCGARYAVAVSNGTSAIEIILRALEIEGKSVIVPTNTFLATAYAVMHAGNRVIFADSDPETFALDPADVERRIALDTKAVIVVHIGGLITPAVDQLKQICSGRGLVLIEDCAHAHGSSYRGRRAGTLGVAGAFSFFPTKVLVTGEGGMVTTDDETLYKAALKIRNHGKDAELGNRMSIFGNNLRISEFTAAIGVEQMSRSGALVDARQQIAAWYDEALGRQDLLRPVRPAPQTTSTFYKYIAYLPDGCSRDRVKYTMKESFGVALTGEVYADLCHREPLWQRYNGWGRLRSDADTPRDLVVEGSYPGADHLSGRHVCLPLYPGLTRSDVSHVVDSLMQAVAQEVGSAV